MKISYSTDPEFKRAYVARTEIKSACNNPNHNNYKNNGALGISYDKRWHNFENFLDDVGNCPSPEHLLVRLDSTKDWCKSNCEWQITGTAHNYDGNDYTKNPEYQKTYAIWNSIKGKCNNKNHQQYSEVGAKGITYPVRWHKFINFLEDMGKKPGDGYSLLRYDKSGDYSVENCYWSTDAPAKAVVNINYDEITFNCWNALRQRCDNENNSSYKYYGGRGITYSEEFSTYEGFFAAMGKSPGVGYSIDRIKVDGNYCKENCRWATYKEQQNNTTRNIFLEYNGKLQTAIQWAEELDIDAKLIYRRIANGWTIERTLTERVATDGHVFEYDGKEYTMKQLVETFDITDASIRGKLKRGKTITEIINEKIFDDKILKLVEKYGCTVDHIRRKLRQNMTLEQIALELFKKQSK